MKHAVAEAQGAQGREKGGALARQKIPLFFPCVLSVSATRVSRLRADEKTKTLAPPPLILLKF
jgi:hypothetical protein